MVRWAWVVWVLFWVDMMSPCGLVRTASRCLSRYAPWGAYLPVPRLSAHIRCQCVGCALVRSSWREWAREWSWRDLPRRPHATLATPQALPSRWRSTAAPTSGPAIAPDDRHAWLDAEEAGAEMGEVLRQSALEKGAGSCGSMSDGRRGFRRGHGENREAGRSGQRGEHRWVDPHLDGDARASRAAVRSSRQPCLEGYAGRPTQTVHRASLLDPVDLRARPGAPGRARAVTVPNLPRTTRTT